MSDSPYIKVLSMIFEESRPKERPHSIFPATRVGINDYFNAFTEVFEESCKKHQKIQNQLYMMLAYMEGGGFFLDAMKIASECSFNKRQLNQIYDYAFKLFQRKLLKESVRYLQSPCFNLNWPYNGSRKCYMEWAARYSFEFPLDQPCYEDLQNIYGKYVLKDSEKYFHFRAKTFYINVYLPNIEKMTANALALRARKKQQFEKDLDVEQVVKRIAAIITVSPEEIERCKMQ